MGNESKHDYFKTPHLSSHPLPRRTCLTMLLRTGVLLSKEVSREHHLIWTCFIGRNMIQNTFFQGWHISRNLMAVFAPLPPLSLSGHLRALDNDLNYFLFNVEAYDPPSSHFQKVIHWFLPNYLDHKCDDLLHKWGSLIHVYKMKK